MTTKDQATAFDAFEHRGWLTAAAAYDTFFTPVTAKVVDPLLDAVEAGPGSDLLDMACGTGHLLASACSRGINAVGIDASPAMVELARHAAPEASVRTSDVQDLSFPDDSFDAVTAAFVLMHVAAPTRVVSEAVRILRRGGRLGVAVWDDPSRTRLIGWILDAIAMAGASPSADVPDGPPFFAYADEAALVQLLEQNGLADVAVHTVEFTHLVDTLDEVWTGLTEGTVRTAALLRGQDDATRSRVHEAFVSLAAPHTDADGVHIPVSVKLGVGQRS